VGDEVQERRRGEEASLRGRREKREEEEEKREEEEEGRIPFSTFLRVFFCFYINSLLWHMVSFGMFFLFEFLYFLRVFECFCTVLKC
jgi:hypothetical protein